jgi:rare lipoprotein A
MSVKQAENYDETGIASWYGYETVRQNHGAMTANGEAFDPNGLTAAHKYLPLPTHVKVTNLENERWVILRVNDRGPFPSDHNPRSGDRIIDVSAGAAKKLGFYKKGTARVRVEAIQLKESSEVVGFEPLPRFASQGQGLTHDVLFDSDVVSANASFKNLY